MCLRTCVLAASVTLEIVAKQVKHDNELTVSCTFFYTVCLGAVSLYEYCFVVYCKQLYGSLIQ